MLKKRDHSLRILGCAVFIVTNLLLLSPGFSGSSLLARAAAKNPQRPSNPVFLPIITSGSAAASIASDWLVYLNDYRSMARLSPVTENPAWSNGGQLHSRYMVKNNVLSHDEDANNPWYTAEGKAAAQAGNLMASSSVDTSDTYAIDSWMQAPFHALGILDPSLQTVGFGSYREANGGLQMGASLDVLRGLGPEKTTAYPVMWPGNDATTPLGVFWGEHPDPLTSCSGYSAPSGLPIILQIGPGHLTPQVSASSFKQGSTSLEHCVFTEATYKNPTPDSQNLGRAILNQRDAVVLIPRLPLKSGSTYSASITVNGQNYTWSFRTSGALHHEGALEADIVHP